jgi:hypothetical protein
MMALKNLRAQRWYGGPQIVVQQLWLRGWGTGGAGCQPMCWEAGGGGGSVGVNVALAKTAIKIQDKERG